MSNIVDTPSVWSGPENDTSVRLQRHPRTGAVLPTRLNAYIVLTTDSRWSDRIWYSPSDSNVYVRLPGETQIRALLNEGVTQAVSLWLEAVYQFRAPHLSPLIKLIAEDNAKDMPVQELFAHNAVDLNQFWQVHPWFKPIREYAESQILAFPMEQLTRSVFGCGCTPMNARDIAYILHRLGFMSVRQVVDGVRRKVWTRGTPINRNQRGEGRPRRPLPKRKRRF